MEASKYSVKLQRSNVETHLSMLTVSVGQYASTTCTYRACRFERNMIETVYSRRSPTGQNNKDNVLLTIRSEIVVDIVMLLIALLSSEKAHLILMTEKSLEQISQGKNCLVFLCR